MAENNKFEYIGKTMRRLSRIDPLPYDFIFPYIDIYEYFKYTRVVVDETKLNKIKKAYYYRILLSTLEIFHVNSVTMYIEKSGVDLHFSDASYGPSENVIIYQVLRKKMLLDGGSEFVNHIINRDSIIYAINTIVDPLIVKTLLLKFMRSQVIQIEHQ